MQESKTNALSLIDSQALDGKNTDGSIPDALLFSSIADEWFAINAPSWKPSSKARYRNILDIQLLPAFGKCNICTISRSDIMSFSSRMLSSGSNCGKGLAPKTVTTVLSVLKMILSYAEQVKGLRVASLDGLRIKKPAKQLRVFSRNEQIMITQYLKTKMTPCKLGILITLYTGLRIGEICALSWGDISAAEQMIHVRKTMQRIQLHGEEIPKTKVIVTSPKSACSMRDIPIPNDLFHIIEDFRKDDDCFVLTSRADHFMEPRTLENHFHTMAKACDIRGATMHSCRHTFATRCVELGFDIKTLSEILGHASVSITMNLYVHPSMELKQLNMEKLSELISTQE